MAGDVCLGQQLMGVEAIGGDHGDADTAVDADDFVILDVRNLTHVLEDLTGYVAGLAPARIGYEYGELIAAEARDDAIIVDRVAEAFGHGLDQAVAGGMPAGVVDVLELVEIDKVVAIIGALASGVTVPVAESVTIPAGVIMISPASTSPLLTVLPADQGKDFLFRTCPSDALQGVVAGRLAASYNNSQHTITYVTQLPHDMQVVLDRTLVEGALRQGLLAGGQDSLG